MARQAADLAHVFLRQSDDPGFLLRQTSIESFDDEYPVLFELLYPSICDRYAERRENLRAQPLVVHRSAQIDAATAGAQREFEDVRRRRGTHRAHPFAVRAEQRRFFLSPCQ